MFERLAHASRNLQAVLLGQRCASCERPCSGTAVCGHCTALATQILPRCPRCATVQRQSALCGACISKPPAFDASLCAGSFTQPLSQLISQYKFEGRLVLAPWLAGILNAALAGKTFDLIVPVPLFDTRLKERGFNQVWEIVKHLESSVPKCHALTRLRDTPSQRSVSAAQRFANVRHAFAADECVHGRHVLLVDDVVTTTATVESASKALKAAGASHVTVACLARVSD
jgi:ComF family protein